MGFMVPVAEHLVMYHVETEVGLELVPQNVCGILDLAAMGVHGPGRVKADLRDYLEGSTVREVERKEGWYSRLSAPGYTDTTSWMGPYGSADEALAEVKAFRLRCPDNVNIF